MDVKCPGCLQITTVFSHAQTVVLCGNCNQMLCQPTGGLARLTAPQHVMNSCLRQSLFGSLYIGIPMKINIEIDNRLIKYD
ncbi:unnamed protein product [Durusdinium trenchii]|uniref:Uncharacterized protein n=2 Tax=Durusdinium trenchii TaxID=1381693 RepID=A0ABP0NV92_9DINO